MRGASFASRFAVGGSVGSLLALGLLAAVVRHRGDRRPDWDVAPSSLPFPPPPPYRGGRAGRRHRRTEASNGADEDEGGDMSCGDIFRSVKKTPMHQFPAPTNGDSDFDDDDYDARLCDYAQSCEGGFPFQLLPLILCHGVDAQRHTEYSISNTSNNRRYYLEGMSIYLLLPPFLILYLLLLFRLLATTADCYFSPALESFGFELGLPPRFAGATLLALGNGSPDLGATIDAVSLWNEGGAADLAGARTTGAPWTMGVGSLIGGGMFVGTVVCGLIVRACGGIPCRAAFLRDVSMYAVSVGVVWSALESGEVTRGHVRLFLGLYLAYVAVVFASDVYHRRVTLPRLAEEGRKRRRASLIALHRQLSHLAEERGEDVHAIVQKQLSILSERTDEDGGRDEVDETIPPAKRLKMLHKKLSKKLSEKKASGDVETTPLMMAGSTLRTYGEGSVKGFDDDDDDDDDGSENGDLFDALTSVPDFRQMDSSSSGGHLSTASGHRVPKRAKLSIPDRFGMLMSNYDPRSVKFEKFDALSSSSGSDDRSEEENIANVIHEIQETKMMHPGFLGHRAAAPKEAEEDERGQRGGGVARTPPGSPTEEPDGPGPIAGGEEVRAWLLALLADARDELAFRHRRFMRDSFEAEASPLDKVCLFLELPLVAIRTLTTPVPCEEHYCRPILALSIALSPCWVLYYLEISGITAAVYCFICLSLGLVVLRYAHDDRLPLLASVPISLYGFFIAATYIGVFADLLVGLLQFLGTICRIPSTILGMTVLAWGNSMGDLSANVAMARKGMPDMATTGCFAGPSFNLLVGTGLGFWNLQRELGRPTVRPVSLTPTIRIGFGFIVANCSMIVLCSGICFRWRLPYRYSFALFALYLLFIAMSLETIF